MRGSNGIGTGSPLQKFAQQRYSPRQNRAAETWYPRAITFLSKLQLIGGGPDWASKCVQVKITGHMGIRLVIMARGQGLWPSGLGALPRTGGWGYGPYHRVRAQGPQGLGTLYHKIYIYIYIYKQRPYVGKHEILLSGTFYAKRIEIFSSATSEIKIGRAHV